MGKPDFLQGYIFVKETFHGQQPAMKFMPFDFSPSVQVGIGDIIMMNFKCIHLSREEKQILTAKCRQYIFHFQHLDLQNLIQNAESLVERIIDSPLSEMILEAKGLGAFICLTAILSGKIPPEKKICFYLQSTPLILYPKKLAMKMKPQTPPSQEIFMVLDENCWLQFLPSLTSCPKYLHLDFKVIKNSEGPRGKFSSAC